jgi:hypothetical protein
VDKIAKLFVLLISDFATFPAGFDNQWFINKDPTLWVDGARPINTCIPPTITWNMHAQARA